MKKRLIAILAMMTIWFGISAIPLTYTFTIGDIEHSTYLNGVLITLKYLVDENDTVILDIDSPGGSAWMGMAIANAVMSTEADTICRNNNVAASAGAIIYMSCDKREYSPHSIVMVHRAFTQSFLGEKRLVPEDHMIAMQIKDYLRHKAFPYMPPLTEERYDTGEDVSMMSYHITQEEK